MTVRGFSAQEIRARVTPSFDVDLTVRLALCAEAPMLAHIAKQKEKPR